MEIIEKQKIYRNEINFLRVKKIKNNILLKYIDKNLNNRFKKYKRDKKRRTAEQSLRKNKKNNCSVRKIGNLIEKKYQKVNNIVKQKLIMIR